MHGSTGAAAVYERLVMRFEVLPARQATGHNLTALSEWSGTRSSVKYYLSRQTFHFVLHLSLWCVSPSERTRGLERTQSDTVTMLLTSQQTSSRPVNSRVCFYERETTTTTTTENVAKAPAPTSLPSLGFLSCNQKAERFIGGVRRSQAGSYPA